MHEATKLEPTNAPSSVLNHYVIRTLYLYVLRMYILIRILPSQGAWGHAAAGAVGLAWEAHDRSAGGRAGAYCAMEGRCESLYIYICVCVIYVFIYSYIYMYIHVNMYIYMHISVGRRTSRSSSRNGRPRLVLIYIYLGICHTFIHIYICIYICEYVYMYTYIGRPADE